MNFKHLLDIRLNLFDGGGAAGGAGAGAAASGDGAPGTQGETQASPASTRRGKSGEYQNVIFGKQAKPAEAGEGGDRREQQQSSDARERQQTGREHHVQYSGGQTQGFPGPCER